MGKLPTVTCRKCGESYSALRADCPHCGARREMSDRIDRNSVRHPSAPKKKITNAPETGGGSNWQLVAGLLLIGAAILAVVLMVAISRAGNGGLSVRVTQTPTPNQTVQPRPTPTPTPTPQVNSIKLFYLDNEITAEGGGFTMYVGDDPLTVTARAYSNEKLGVVPFTWSVSDSSKAILTPSADTQSCEVQVLESAGGYITLTVRGYGAELAVPLYIWSRD